MPEGTNPPRIAIQAVYDPDAATPDETRVDPVEVSASVNKRRHTRSADGLLPKLLQWFPVAFGLGVDELTVAASINPSIQKLHSLSVLWPAEVDRICAEEAQAQFLIQDFLPAKSIAIAGGESTIGKSALTCQIGLCVAAGIPFLGMRAEQGRVLYFDLENSLIDCKGMRDSLLRFLGIAEAPRDFLLTTQPPTGGLENLLEEVSPKLVVIDSLRSFRPDVTEKNKQAAEWLMEIRRLSRKHDCTFLIVHHLRKPSREMPQAKDLETTNVASWLLDMEGPRALVNQTDVRIAIAEGDNQPAALQMKWSLRVRGDSPVVQLERIFNDDAEPAGYRHLIGAGLLNSPEKRAAFESLPAEFTTAQAKEARRQNGLGEGNDPTNKFLAECRQLRLIERIDRGRWRKRVA